LVKEALFQACRHFLRPIVRFLLRNGVTWNEFNELSKNMYVEVARQEYGIQGRPTNNARVAVITGLNRREVSRIRNRLLQGSDNPDMRQGNRISRILTGWHVDPEFLGADSEPADLSATGPEKSLSCLLKRYAGDLPHGALKKEMLQLGLIRENPDGRLKVLQRDYVYTTLDPEIVRQMSVALHDHATTLEHNINPERERPVRFERMADNARIPSRSAKRFMKLVENRGMEFLQEIDTWLSTHETVESKSGADRNLRLGVGVYLIHDDSQ
jgi:uncharacterized protein DUF6502